MTLLVFENKPKIVEAWADGRTTYQSEILTDFSNKLDVGPDFIVGHCGDAASGVVAKELIEYTDPVGTFRNQYARSDDYHDIDALIIIAQIGSPIRVFTFDGFEYEINTRFAAFGSGSHIARGYLAGFFARPTRHKVDMTKLFDFVGEIESSVGPLTTCHKVDR